MCLSFAGANPRSAQLWRQSHIKKKNVKMRKKRGGMDCKILCSQTYITATTIFCFSFDAYLEISCTG